MKETCTIRVTIQQAGRGSWLETHMLTIQATSLGRAEQQAKRQALAGRLAPFYAYAHLTREP